jgi:2-polyprenyl-6-methoxyphenol hydroxylase-like FAD-dependent oxidoreductase
MKPFLDAGGQRTHLRVWTRWGWIDQPREGKGNVSAPALNLRREAMDPIVRKAAADTPGVELMLGRSVEGLIRDGETFCGVEAKTRDGEVERIRAKLVVGADGRASKVAKLAGVKVREAEHGRFCYGAYFEDPDDADPNESVAWMTDPDWGARFPTDDGLTLYACMPTKAHLPDFKRDLPGAYMAFMRNLPEPPPIDRARLASEFFGKISMPDVQRGPIAPGLALVGDAAVAADPLFGIGCGWAFEGSVRLADTVSPALLGSEPLSKALKRYRRAHRRALAGHMFLIDDYASGRKFTPFERILFSAAAADEHVAEAFHDFGARHVGPQRLVGALPRVLAVQARRALGAGQDRHGPAALSRSA